MKVIFQNLFLLSLSLASVPALGRYSISSSCEKIDQDLQAVRQWTQSRKGSCGNMEVKKSLLPGSGMCEANVEKCLPAEVTSFLETSPETSGPNCWNLALYMAGVVPARRYVDSAEMTFFMNSPLCRQLKATEAKRPGDIGALRSRGDEIHGFMWISDNLVLTKNGKGTTSRYQFQNVSDVVDHYKSGNGPLDLDTYRCRSLEDYLRDPKTKIPKELQKAFINLDHAEKCASLVSFFPAGIDRRAQKQISGSLGVVAAAMESAEFKKSLERLPQDQKDFIKGALSVRLNSMIDQLGMNFVDLKDCDHCLFMKVKAIEAKEALSK